jgi:hypothetical protein
MPVTNNCQARNLGGWLTMNWPASDVEDGYRVSFVRGHSSINLVIAELKRTEDGGHMKLQAIRILDDDNPHVRQDIRRSSAGGGQRELRRGLQ